MSEFKAAIHAVGNPVAEAWRLGKQALAKGHKDLVCCTDGKENRWSGSIELDAALEKHPKHAQANRWDYGLGYVDTNNAERALWVEVHSAYTSEVDCVIKKLKWLKEFLNQQSCSNLKKLTNATPEKYRYVWVASGRYDIPAHAPQLRRLREHGLERPVKRLDLRDL